MLRLLVILGLLISEPALALKFRPFVTELAPVGRGSKANFQVENDKNSPVAVQLSVVRRTIDNKGEEHRVNAESDFVIYPMQIILKKGQKRNVRVQYVGEDTDVEIPYRIIAEELPVNLSGEAKKGVEFLIRYENATYITPENAEHDIAVKKHKIRGKKLQLTIANNGNKHKVIKKVHLVIDGKEYRASALDGSNLLAGAERVYNLKLPARKNSKIEIKYK